MELQAIKQRLSKVNWVCVGLIILLLLAIASAIYNWRKPARTVTTTAYQTVPIEKKVETIKRITVPGPERIVTIEKPVIVEKLSLPQDIAKDPTKQIVANGEITTEDGDVVSTVAVMETPEGHPATVSIIAKEKPQPFFGLPSEFELGARYGVSTDGGQLGNGYLRWTFARLGKVYLGGYTEISTKPDAKAMIDVSYRW